MMKDLDVTKDALSIHNMRSVTMREACDSFPNVSQDEAKQRVYDLLGGGVLNELSVRVVVEGEEIEEESAVDQFIQTLKERSHLHFHAAGA